LYSGQKEHFVKELLAGAALGTGKFGRGELSGLQANLRALCVVFSPWIYSAARTVGLKAGFPAAYQFAVAGVCILAEILHRAAQRAVKAKAEKDKLAAAGEAAK